MKGSDNGPVVSCLLETNQSQAITFKFDLREADVTAISYKMVRLRRGSELPFVWLRSCFQSKYFSTN